MAESKPLSAPVRLLVHFLLTVLLVYLMNTFLNQIFSLTGGISSYIIVGALLTLMNVIVRPILHVLTLPLKLFATILALILVNGIFLWFTMKIADRFDPSLVVLHVDQGIGGWILVAIILGVGNWVIKEILR